MLRRLGSRSMLLVAAAAALLMAGSSPSLAQTPLAQVCFSPDITVDLSGTTLGPNQVGCDNLSGTVTAHTFSGIAPGVHVTGYLPLSQPQVLLTFNVTAALPTNGSGGIVTASPRDVAVFNPTTGFFGSTLFFEGSLNGVPGGSRIRSLSMDAGNNLLLVFDVTTALPGPSSTTITAKVGDVVKLTGTAQPYSVFFDSAATGVPPGMKVTGATLLKGNGDLLLSFDISGKLGSVNFDGNDAVEFAPPSSGSAWSDATCRLVGRGNPRSVCPDGGHTNRYPHCDCHCNGYRNRDCNRDFHGNPDCDHDFHGNPDCHLNCNSYDHLDTYCDRHGHSYNHRNCHAHRDADSHSHCNANADGNAYLDCDADGYKDCDCDSHRDLNSNSHGNGNTHMQAADGQRRVQRWWMAEFLRSNLQEPGRLREFRGT